MIRVLVFTLCLQQLAFGWLHTKTVKVQTGSNFAGQFPPGALLSRPEGSMALFGSSSLQPWRVQRKWLPVQRKPASVFSLLASTMPLLKAGRRSADFQKYLPPESTLRITKALLRQKHTFPEVPLSNAVQDAVPAAAKNARTLFFELILKLAVTFQVINRKIFESFRLSGTVVSRTAPQVGVDDGKTWAARKIVELSAVAATAVESTPVVIDPTVELTVLKTCYAPWTVKHLAMLAEAKAAVAEAEAAPSVFSASKSKKSYWPQRYW